MPDYHPLDTDQWKRIRDRAAESDKTFTAQEIVDAIQELQSKREYTTESLTIVHNFLYYLTEVTSFGTYPWEAENE